MKSKKSSKTLFTSLASMGILIAVAVAWAQRYPVPPSIDRRGVPEWELDNEMPRDVFTFVRIRYGS